MKPILFNIEMVRAILDGRKTTTRQIIKPQPEFYIGDWEMVGRNPYQILTDGCGNSLKPAYQTGNILYVRETFNSDWCDHTIYKADGGSAKDAGYSAEPKWHPSIYMPKKTARIFLKVTNVRAERLQEINSQGQHDGILKEGVTVIKSGYERNDAIFCFSALWNSTIKESDVDRYGWDANPWVWVYEFERTEKHD